ncbi:hypothetical protein K501DRAFT_67674 [Backusella circina FSU 941]|nr:hypothetical protein K501DRAFT_67674 [Backusella circina FSU 941]
MTRKESFDNILANASYDIYGVIGFIEGFKEKYMLVISAIQHRGEIFGNNIAVVERITCVPFHPQKAVQKLDSKIVFEEDEEDQDKKQSNILYAQKKKTVGGRPYPVMRQSSSLITRFKETFQKKKEVDPLRDLVEPKIPPEILKSSSSTSSSSSSSSSVDDDADDDDALELRLQRQVTEMFSRSMFVYSTTCDITRSFQASYEKSKSDPTYDDDTVPLCKKVDSRFWWNEHISRDFITQKLDDWVIPIMQGTIQIEPCHIEGYAFDFILISRRSRERAGMRYQRRGINDQGQVANFVETEQIVLFKRDDANHAASFIQTRGSIPLFWSQSPYSLHPVPALDRGQDENKQAFYKHFKTQEKLYGRQIAVNLTELSGREAIVGAEYRKQVENLGDSNIKYVEFDFHRETKGMRYENITKLSTSLYDDLSKIQYFWETQGEQVNVYCEQTGVFRTNCMDCLDRTNVVQSAFGRSVLNLQLMRFGISEYPEQGIKYYDEFERIFNNVWANNGDMISRMYAGTSALKGDFTRTGKRNITGMMNDASNSLARLYFNTVKDFWRQATVDFVLGYHKAEIFRHVPQSTKMSAEPGIERHWAKIRSDAVDISAEIVIADDETKIAGWTLLSPPTREDGKKRSSLLSPPPTKDFEEKVVLLTKKALYVCSYNYSLEKVVQFKRLSLDMIISIQMGEYILSSLTPQSRSEDQNYGMIITHWTDGEHVRWNTGNFRNQNLGDLNIDEQGNIQFSEGEEEDEEKKETGKKEEDGEKSRITFRVVRYNVFGELDGKVETGKQQITKMVESIAEACGQKLTDDSFVIRKPIISLEQAEKTDGIFKKMEHKIKQAIWL